MCIASLVMDDIIHNMQQQQLIKQVTLPSHSKWSPKMTKKSLLSNNQSLPKSQAGAAVRRQLSKRGGLMRQRVGGCQHVAAVTRSALKWTTGLLSNAAFFYSFS